jgi:serine/threonine-protein kinase
MGMVYRAEHLRLGRTVALKVLATELASDQGFRERFERESRLAALIDHPNIIPVYEEGEADGLLFIAMRWVEGSDLREILEREGPLDPERVVVLIEQVAAALDAAHERGLLHRDVKPGNVLVTAGARQTEHVYLTDFGIAKLMSASALTRTGSFLGTPDYAAPEQFEGKELDPRADVYALGCLLFHCLSGHRPFERTEEVAVMYAHLNEPPPAISTVRQDVPRAFDDVIARAMAKRRDDRYPTCLEVALAARAALRGQAGRTAVDTAAAAAAAATIAAASDTAEAVSPVTEPPLTPPTTPAAPAVTPTPPTTPATPVVSSPTTPAGSPTPYPPAAPAPAPPRPPAAPPAPEAQPEKPGRRRRWPLVAGAAVVAIVAGAAIGAVLATRGGGEEATTAVQPASPGGTPGATTAGQTPPPAAPPAEPPPATAPPASPPAQAALELQWTPVAADALGGAGAQQILRTTTLPSGTVVAVGTVGLDVDRDGVIWRIPNAGTSPAVEFEPLGGSGEEVMFGVAPVGDSGFAAVGYRQPEPPPADTDAAVWLSTGGAAQIVTEGLAAEGYQKMNRVTAGPGGELVAVGTAGPGYGNGAVPLPTDAAAWSSTDGGASWSRNGDEGLVKDGYQEMRGVVAFGGGFVGVGYDTGDAAVWQSDGSTWTQLGAQPDLVPGGDIAELDMRDVAAWQNGLVAVGEVRTSDGDENGAVWLSPDGQTWTLVTNEDVFGGSDDQRLQGVAAGDFGIVAVGCSGCRSDAVTPVVWTSVDGQTWTRTDGDQLPTQGSRAQLATISQVGTTLVAAGSEQGRGVFDATVWTAPLPG